jgi:hypothetical protein
VELAIIIGAGNTLGVLQTPRVMHFKFFKIVIG